MPAKSKAQRRLMAAAEHGADFPEAKALRRSMTHEQLHDFAATSEHGLPAHVRNADHHKTPVAFHDSRPKAKQRGRYAGEAHAYDFRRGQ